ncbi:xanthine dehydrogenase XdhC [Tanticharoenia sakaeratensis NBRC 103193]|nr:xanthine dehydrogenase XdhC [Tanticharoenia sakaeratensis NBRC 103193]
MKMAITPLARTLNIWQAQGDPIAEIRITHARGSTPRETGACLLVTPTEIHGTIGGGRLESDAIDNARRLLRGENILENHEISLGPSINQCCGGHVSLSITRLDAAGIEALRAEDAKSYAARPTILLFGAGHVGRAMAAAFSLLPFRQIWIDSRAQEFGPIPPNTEPRITTDWQSELAQAPPGSAVLILTHSHTLDALILEAALHRTDLAYLGLIGSKSKRKRFESALIASGISEDRARSFTCPIGANPTGDKRPEIIAAFAVTEVAGCFLRPTSRK